MPAIPPHWGFVIADDSEEDIASSNTVTSETLIRMPLPSVVGCTEPRTSTIESTYRSKSMPWSAARKYTKPSRVRFSTCVPCVPSESSRFCTVPTYVTLGVATYSAEDELEAACSSSVVVCWLPNVQPVKMALDRTSRDAKESDRIVITERVGK